MLIVGAGLSGIGAAHHLQARCPGKSYAILEARDDARRHLGPLPLPGHPLGLRHAHARLPLPPWTDAKSIADGPSILDYVRETAREGGIDRHDPLRPPRRRAPTGRRAEARWTVDGRAHRHRRDGDADLRLPLHRAAATTATTRATRRSSRASSASAAQVVHPQHWPEDLDYAGKRVVVIGSGATAVTLVPAMAETAGARDDAAALADLHRLAARRRPDRQRRCAASCRPRPPTRSCAGRTSLLHDARSTSSAAAARSWSSG